MTSLANPHRRGSGACQALAIGDEELLRHAPRGRKLVAQQFLFAKLQRHLRDRRAQERLGPAAREARRQIFGRKDNLQRADQPAFVINPPSSCSCSAVKSGRIACSRLPMPVIFCMRMAIVIPINCEIWSI